MKTLFLLIAVIFAASVSEAGVSQDEFYAVMELINDGKYDSAKVRIDQIGATYPDDPEYFVLNINYYLGKSTNEFLEIAPGEPSPDETAIIMRDSAGDIAGYLRPTAQFQTDTLMVGIEILRQGLEIHPDRLDMHFGLVHVAESAELYGQMTEALLGILKRSQENNDEWLCSFSEPLSEDPEEFVLENVQSRVFMLFHLESEYADSLMVAISEMLVKAFPDRTYGHTNLGIIHTLRGQYDSSLYHLSEAFLIDSTDMIVAANLADLHEKTGAIEKAVEYYNLIVSKGNPEQRALARQHLTKLGK